MTRRLRNDAAGLRDAAALLQSGALVAFGTETVYGLGGDATNADAVARIFTAKGRPHFNPLICHYPNADAAFADVVANDGARRLAARFWPGPLTMVLPRRPASAVALLAGAGLDSLAVRVPAGVQDLLAAVGRPVAAPSANRSGHISPTSADDVFAELDGRIAAVLDSGPCAVGVESTIVDLCGPTPTLLRPGGITREDLEAEIGPLSEPGDAIRAPGMLASHYAPNAPLRLNASAVRRDEALLAFGPPLPGATFVYQLSAAGDLTEAAANVFAGLRALDELVRSVGLAGIAAMVLPEHGLGVAINDRLRRAAAPR
ncbi:MAG: threonylcarbamoyl-AMP synthase [Acetobacteraceae bacterium]|nr:threonylcarbamoyl-AMP synthase [Acetobacteraceae bacterium]